MKKYKKALSLLVILLLIVIPIYFSTITPNNTSISVLSDTEKNNTEINAGQKNDA